MRSLIKPGLFFLAPAMLVLIAFFFLPICAAFVLSLTDYDIYALANHENARWVGVANYAQLAHEPRFWQSLFNTFYFVGIGGPLTVTLSLATAVLVSSKLTRFKSIWRTIY